MSNDNLNPFCPQCKAYILWDIDNLDATATIEYRKKYGVSPCHGYKGDSSGEFPSSSKLFCFLEKPLPTLKEVRRRALGKVKSILKKHGVTENYQEIAEAIVDEFTTN